MQLEEPIMAQLCVNAVTRLTLNREKESSRAKKIANPINPQLIR